MSPEEPDPHTGIPMTPDPSKCRGEPQQKMTLHTLPLEIKHHIFSHFLLSTIVKQTTNGRNPGHVYKFDTTLMLINKRIKEEATNYLLGHNEFALIHVKFFAFDINAVFLPVVATGKSAKLFKDPSVEATITHLGTMCAGHHLSTSCPNSKHLAKDRVNHVLLLTKHLHRFFRHLQLIYHVWPTMPIYLLSKPQSSPVTYISAKLATRVKLVWKINQGYRQDLNDNESRKRQSRLLEPLAGLVNHGQITNILGADQDLATKVTQNMTPRLLSVDAVGYNLLDLMQKEKRDLDDLLGEDPSSLLGLMKAYVQLAHMAYDTDSKYNFGYETSAIMKTISNGTEITCPAFLTEALAGDEDNPDVGLAPEGSWQLGMLVTAFDCWFTAARLALEQEKYCIVDKSLAALLPLVRHIQIGPLNKSVGVLHNHYYAWLSTVGEQPNRTFNAIYTHAKRLLEDTLQIDETAATDQYILEDIDYFDKVLRKEVKPSKNMRDNCKGLLRRPRLSNIPVQLNKSNLFSGWTTKKQYPEAKVAEKILEYVELGNRDPTLAASTDTLDEGHQCLAFISPEASFAPPMHGVPGVTSVMISAPMTVE